MKYLPLLGLLFAAPALAAPARWEKTGTPERTAEPGKGGEDIRAGGETIGGAGIGRGSGDHGGGSSRGGSGSGSAGGGGGTSASSPGSAMPRFTKVRVYVSNSKDGPWRENGEACRQGTVFTRTTGVDQKDPPKGCASPAASRACLDQRNHRAYENREWIDRNTIQTEMAGSSLPQGKYAGYLSYGADARRVGTIGVRDCPNGPLKYPYPNAKASVANSTRGPFAINGKACNGDTLYARMTGVARAAAPLGCASPMDETFCWDRKNFRVYEPKEWLDSRTIQTVTPGGSFPANTYAFYAASRDEIQFVGWATLEACGAKPVGPPAGAGPAPGAPPAPSGCRWEELTAVFGPCSPPASSCSNGQTTKACGGDWQCVCR